MKYTPLLLILFFASCMTTQKATSYLEDKGELPKICADKFPPKDSIVIRDSIHTDTVYQGESFFDTVYTVTTDTVTRTITKVLPAKVITKTNVQTKEVFRENTARVVQLQGDVSNCIEELNKKNKQITELTEQGNGWKKKAKQRWWIIIALVVLLFRKPLLSLIPYKIPFISK